MEMGYVLSTTSLLFFTATMHALTLFSLRLPGCLKDTSGKNVFPLPKWDRQNLHDENINCNNNSIQPRPNDGSLLNWELYNSSFERNFEKEKN